MMKRISSAGMTYRCHQRVSVDAGSRATTVTPPGAREESKHFRSPWFEAAAVGRIEPDGCGRASHRSMEKRGRREPELARRVFWRGRRIGVEVKFIVELGAIASAGCAESSRLTASPPLLLRPGPRAADRPQPHGVRDHHEHGRRVRAILGAPEQGDAALDLELPGAARVGPPAVAQLGRVSST